VLSPDACELPHGHSGTAGVQEKGGDLEGAFSLASGRTGGGSGIIIEGDTKKTYSNWGDQNCASQKGFSLLNLLQRKFTKNFLLGRGGRRGNSSRSKSKQKA